MNELKALTKLQSHTSVVILPVRKARSTVIFKVCGSYQDTAYQNRSYRQNQSLDNETIKDCVGKGIN